MNSPAPNPQIDAFLAKYSPEIADQLREARTSLRSFFTHGFELVFDNYNALVFGISPTARASEAFISVAGYPKWVTLFFLHGATLIDPTSLLEGTGKQIRSIRLKSASDIHLPDVEALITQAIRPHERSLRDAPALTTVVKTVVAKQRPRRPTETSATRPSTSKKPAKART